jgi:hypothetical protein
MEPAAPPTGKCTSGPDNSCQFAGMLEVNEFEGRFYCEAHAPLNAPGKIGAKYLHEFIARISKSSQKIDLRGTIIPVLAGQLYRFGHPAIDARGCTFEAATKIQVEGDIDMSGSTCLGDFQIYPHAVKLTAHGVDFLGDVSIVCNSTTLVDCTNSKAEKEFTLTGLLPKTSARLTGMTLSFAPVIEVDVSPPKAMPQNSNFHGWRLQRKTAYGGDAEGRYRTIRNLFNASRDREQEGTFYMYEKRARRKNQSMKNPMLWISRFVSACYDWIAGYGQSYERVFGWFLGVQTVFAVVYSIMSARFGWFGKIDSQVVVFTLAQVVKPFELLSARQADHWPYAGIYTGTPGSGWWTFVMMTDTVMSLTLVALFLLALRWRFRRD